MPMPLTNRVRVLPRLKPVFWAFERIARLAELILFGQQTIHATTGGRLAQLNRPDGFTPLPLKFRQRPQFCLGIVNSFMPRGSGWGNFNTQHRRKLFLKTLRIWQGTS